MLAGDKRPGPAAITSSCLNSLSASSFAPQTYTSLHVAVMFGTKAQPLKGPAGTDHAILQTIQILESFAEQVSLTHMDCASRQSSKPLLA